MQTDPSKLPEVQKATATAQRLVELAGDYKVTTAEHYTSAGADLVQVNGAIAHLEELRMGMTRPLDQAKKAIMEFFRGPAEKLERAKAQIKRAMISFDEEQERIRKEEQRRVDEVARKERERLAAIAAETERKAREKADEERRRAEAERKAAEDAQRAADEARRAGDEEAAAAATRTAQEAARTADKFEQRAMATEARAEQRVETLQLTAAAVIAPVLQREAPKVTGVRSRRVWKFEVTDPTQVPRDFLMVDEQKIRRFVGAMKGDARIAGIRVWDEPDLSAAKGAA